MPCKLVTLCLHLMTIGELSGEAVEQTKYPFSRDTTEPFDWELSDNGADIIDIPSYPLSRDTDLESRESDEWFDWQLLSDNGVGILNIPGYSTNNRPGLLAFNSEYDTLNNFPFPKEYVDDGRFTRRKYMSYVTKRRPDQRRKGSSNNNRGGKSPISRFQRNYFPYSNVVRLSTGCTGTLLTPYHVITAAHCVHNGNRYKRNIDMLKVEVPEMIGSRLFYVVEIKVPAMWRKSRTLPGVARGAYDYAVLTLNLPVRGRRRFMHLALPEMSALNSDVHFVSFISDRQHGMVKSTCHPDDNLTVLNGNVLLTSCVTSDKGSSGSAIFTTNGRGGEKMIGILSNRVSTRFSGKDFNAIMLLTRQKCLDICSMIYPDGDDYNSCDSSKTGNSFRQSGRQLNMPIFG